MPFELLASLFLPADGACRTAVVEADATWDLDSVPSDVDAAVWGRLPDRSPPATAIRAAGARTVALRRLTRVVDAPLRVSTTYRLPPRRLDGGRSGRGRLAAAVRQGALVELTSLPPGRRLIDTALREAGGRAVVGDIHAGTGATVVARIARRDGSRAVLRIGRARTAADPTRTAFALNALARAGVPGVPKILTTGAVDGAAWVAEQELPGRAPSRLTRRLARDVLDACARLPRSDAHPTAVIEDLDALAAAVPALAGRLASLGTAVTPRVRRFPSVVRHGDLWTGNLLAAGGRLTGLLDWDAYHRYGVPGADLLHLVATDERRRGHCSLGAQVAGRPWRSPTFRAASREYWPAVGAAPIGDDLDVVGVAWWAAAAAGTVARLPHRARDERWLDDNVVPALVAFGY